MVMRIEDIPISRITRAPYNPRKHLRPEDPAYQSIVRSLDEFGMVQFLVWNERTGHLVSGHQRLSVLTAQGIETVQAVVVDLPLHKEKQLNLALNRIDGEWDRDKLADLLGELNQQKSFDPVSTGFASSEIDELLASLKGSVEPDGDGGDTAGPDTPPITEPGELIKIGPHRIICGDASDPETLARLMGAEQAGMLFADPPYNVAYDGKNRPTAAPSRDWIGLKNDKLSGDQYRDWTQAWIAAVLPHLTKGAGIYLWNGFANFGLMADLLTTAGVRPRHVLTWAKESFAPGHGDFNEQTEFCLYARAPGKGRWFGPRNESTLWQITRDRTDSYVHPTQKALPLAERAIRNSSQRGEIVLDPFLGSGTSLVASARMGRRCFATEIEPKYCDAAVRRLIATAGRSGVPRRVLKRWRTGDA